MPPNTIACWCDDGMRAPVAGFEARTAGVVIRYPRTIMYMEDI